MRPLKLVHPANIVKNTAVSVDFELRDRALVARFEVRGAAAPYVNKDLARDRSQHGLWDWDVVEVFVRPNPASSDYFEFQVSPLGQFFELQIHEPRKRVNARFHCEGLEYSAYRLKIPLDPLGWDGRVESVTGGAFAILGEPRARTYWALFLPKQDTPDFHLPERFGRLL
jgi:hypothetical protein